MTIRHLTLISLNIFYCQVIKLVLRPLHNYSNTIYSP